MPDVTTGPVVAPWITHQPSLLGGAENMKLLFDDTMAHLARSRTNATSHDNAWESLRYTVAANNAFATHAYVWMSARLRWRYSEHCKLTSTRNQPLTGGIHSRERPAETGRE